MQILHFLWPGYTECNLFDQTESNRQFLLQIAELKEQLNDLKESLSNKEKLISQLTNQIQASNQANQSEAPREDKEADLRNENEDLKVDCITRETSHFEFSIWFTLILSWLWIDFSFVRGWYKALWILHLVLLNIMNWSLSC